MTQKTPKHRRTKGAEDLKDLLLLLEGTIRQQHQDTRPGPRLNSSSNCNSEVRDGKTTQLRREKSYYYIEQQTKQLIPSPKKIAEKKKSERKKISYHTSHLKGRAETWLFLEEKKTFSGHTQKKATEAAGIFLRKKDNPPPSCTPQAPRSRNGREPFCIFDPPPPLLPYNMRKQKKFDPLFCHRFRFAKKEAF